MPELNPEAAFDEVKTRTLAAIRAQFPMAGTKHRLELVNLVVEDNLHLDDIQSQYQKRVEGGTWAVPVKATLRLVEISSGKKLDENTIVVARIPKITRRYSYIVDGHERQHDSVFLLKPGVYHRVADNGEIQARWAFQGKKGFDLDIDRASGRVTVAIGTSTVPIYSVLKALNVSDDDMEKALGKDVFAANKAKSKPEDLLKIPKTFAKTNEDKKKVAGMSTADAAAYVQKLFQEMRTTRPDGDQHNTLGVEFGHVTAPSLMASAKRVLDISRGKAEPDDRQSLAAKDITSTPDFVERFITRGQRDITRKITAVIDRASRLADLPVRDLYTGAIGNTFRGAQLPEQTNPLQFLSGHMRTTILGADFGGIKGGDTIKTDDKLINPSHLGFLDPVQTPESESTGISLHLPIGARKKGKILVTRVWDVKKGAFIEATPGTLERAVVAYPDQVSWKNGKPEPVSDLVTVYDAQRRTAQRPWSEVQYVLPSSKGLFSFAANLIPFLSTNSGNRTMFATKQMEQAISLKNREAPLVQTKTDGGYTFEQLVGSFGSHASPVAGTVTKITEGEVQIKGSDGKISKVSLYDHFPLNGGKTMMHSEPLVRVGDKVTKGQTIADTNYTKDGHIALGTNMRVGYMTYHGRTFEDSIVISQSASERLISTHLHEMSVDLFAGMQTDKKRWTSYSSPDKATPARLSKLGDDGVIKEGQRVQHGDVLIAVVSPARVDSRDEARTIARSLATPYDTRGTVYWEHDYPGVVAKIARSGKSVKVFVRTEEPATIGDKLTGRYGNKGIIGTILPDHEMPKNKAGEPLHVILGPAGVPSRMNIGQLLETAASKIAKKTGKPYVVDNFSPGVDYTQKVMDELKKHNLSDTEELFDPKTGRSLGQILTGDKYLLKLHHQVDKKMTARSHGGAYDSNGEPPGGSGIPGGGQTLDQLTTYALLAHGATNILREAQTWKSDQSQADVWIALQQNRPLPDPKPNKSMGKFINYMRGMGMHMEKKGDKYVLQPLTDKQTLHFSTGKLSAPSRLTTIKGDLKQVTARTIEDKGGLFDKKLTGGLQGNFWTHIDLHHKLPNPVFEGAIQSLTGINAKTYEQLTSAEGHQGGKLGTEVIVDALKKINIDKELKETEAQLPKLKGAPLDRAYRRVRYLQALKKTGLTAVDAYTMNHLPVLPPTMRPIMVNPDGSQTVDDLNLLYQNVGILNESLRKNVAEGVGKAGQQKQVADLYDAVKSLRVGGMDIQQKSSKARHYRGLMELMEGTKGSYFQSSVVYRRQDLSGRSTIITAPELGLDEVGIPMPVAFEMYKPFVVKDLVAKHNYLPHEAKKMVDEKHSFATEVLHRVVADRPVLLKRDPALHKFSIMAFTPRITEGKAIGLHPLVTTGFNADHDGDAMAMFVPLGNEAVEDAKKMFPSNNLFSPTSGTVMSMPEKDLLIGLFQATKWGDEKAKVKVSTAAEAHKLWNEGKVKEADLITLNGRETTVGRAIIASLLPLNMQHDDKLLHDKTYRFDKGTLQALLTRVGKEHKQDYARVVKALQDFSVKAAYFNGSSFSLHDFHDALKLRDDILGKYEAEEKKIRASKISDAEKDQKIVQLYSGALDEIKKRGEAAYGGSKNKMYEWVAAKARGNWEQFRQMTFGPILVADAKNRPVALPITKSYAEGLTTSQYWTSMHGARKGAIDRAAGTAEPGAMSKVIINTVIDHQITGEDCHTTKGAALSIDDRDVHDRYLAQPVHIAAGKDVPAGTLLTSSVVQQIRSAKVAQVVVRSPLHCQMPKGICAKCYGLNENGHTYKVGTNVGVIAGHSLGEPVTQLAMKTFHTGGAVSSQKGSDYTADAFERVKQIFYVPTTLPGAATVASVAGTITKIQEDKARGGYHVYVGATEHRILADRHLKEDIKVGATVKAGQPLTYGAINPHDLLAATNNIHAVRGYLTDEALSAYGNSGVKLRRRNVETVVKAMTNVARVEHAPDHPEYLRGQLVALDQVENLNRQAKTQNLKPIEYTHVLKSMQQVPLTYSEDFLARANYRYLKNTFEEAASQAWTSDIHGSHVAGLAHGAEYGLKKPQPLLPPNHPPPPGLHK
jgi:DNA-directed RNA polymerase subunit beta'